MADKMGFATWADVLEYAKTGGPLFYQAPLDTYASRFDSGRGAWTYKASKKTIRLTPNKSAADPFTANAGHLDRFSRPRLAPGAMLDAAIKAGNARGHLTTACVFSLECARCSASCSIDPNTGATHGERDLTKTDCPRPV